MTTIFDGYDEEYRTLANDISKKLSEVACYEEQKDKKKVGIVHVGDLLTQASQLIQQMELEVRSLDAATRRELSKKVDQYKKSLASLLADHKKIREKEEREGLFGDRDGNATLAEHRGRMAAATNKMKGTTDKLAAARKEIADTEEVGNSCHRRRTWPKSREDSVYTRKSEGCERYGSSRRQHCCRMSARDKRQRLALSIAAGFIILAILLLIYFGIFKKK
ncbi:putative vesicle transport v-SNARE domain superfamily protein [Plasmopara halstedii]